MAHPRTALMKRLSGYWKMEAANAVLLPSVIFWLLGWRVDWPLAVTLLAMVFLLVIGALYWRAKWLQLKQDDYDLAPLLRRLRQLKWPVAVLTLVAVALAIASLAGMFGHGTGQQIAIAVAATLAALEYVNYYHVQLQHFDHAADFQRLMSGRGFRKSQMARDLERLD